MDLILFDKDSREIGPAKLEVDFEVGDSSTSNDFEITTAMTDFQQYYKNLEGMELARSSFSVDHFAAIRE